MITLGMDSKYADDGFPWNFYFNDDIMPKWGASWGLAHIVRFLHPEDNAGDRDVYDVYCSIDHTGVVESAEPDAFIFAVQEVLHILLSQREAIFSALAGQSYGKPNEIYSGLVEAALRMRELAVTQCRALWTSGYESDRERLVDVMRRCELPSTSPEHSVPPHIQRIRRDLQLRREAQVRRLHQLAQSGQLDKEMRKRLHEIRAA